MLWQYTRNSGHVLTYMTLKYLEQFTLRECKHVSGTCNSTCKPM